MPEETVHHEHFCLHEVDFATIKAQMENSASTYEKSSVRMEKAVEKFEGIISNLTPDMAVAKNSINRLWWAVGILSTVHLGIIAAIINLALKK